MHAITPYGMHYTQVSHVLNALYSFPKTIFWNLLSFELNMAHSMLQSGQCFGAVDV